MKIIGGMSIRQIIYGITILIATVQSVNFCGKTLRFREPKGAIETSTDLSVDLTNCTWTIVATSRSVILLKIEFLQLGSYDTDYEEQKNCLHFVEPHRKTELFKLCNDVTYFNTISVPANEVEINLRATSESYLRLVYTSYIVNCSYDALKCYSPRGYPRKSDKICIDGMLVCQSYCRYGYSSCGLSCYNIQKQRCDEIIDCPTGEDELNCHPEKCPDQISCKTENKCIESRHICDKTVDCENGLDETGCEKFACEQGGTCNLEKITLPDSEGSLDTIYIVAIIFGITFILMMFVVCKCLARKRNIRHMLDHPLDIPLPPFRGPGEGGSSTSNTADAQPYVEEDFMPGGEIYESFVANLEKIKSKRKSKLDAENVNDRVTFVKPSKGQSVLEKYFDGVRPDLSEDMAALASLKISRDQCRGLRKTKSEERPLTKRLFIDNKDDVSEDSDKENDEATSSRTKKAYRAAHSKSDTYHVRKTGPGVKFM